MARARTVWRCQTCGASAPRWLGRCNECGEFGTFVEEAERESRAASSRSASNVTPVPLSSVGADEAPRIAVGIPELDRALGGGLVSGSLVLLGGEPGIGKSTLILQAADALGKQGRRVLYVCGEESPQQIGLRARRISAISEGVELLAELDIAAVEVAVTQTRPDFLVLDSIQTAFDPDLEGAPGSVGQVRSCTARLMRIAKDLGVTTLIVGHVTKEGAIAGPRVLEHMVDAVLYFEGDRDHAFRVVRTVKNRFGSASEVGIFEMTEGGLLGVDSPSALLEERADVPGSAVMSAMEGSRPLLVEIQALVSPSYLPAPRRLATGIDSARLLQVLAVLERRAGLSFAGADVIVSVAGGLRISEPAVDAPLALALASALQGRSVPSRLVAFGELGLTGRLRPVGQTEARVKEAGRLGFDRVAAVMPSTGSAQARVAFERAEDAAGLVALLS
ncbi:MAG: DNA repair protein RadA [Coriobacteriales bacterium]|nr:DNA repair protein RadA [Coriobacteriales bacterium]